MTIDLRSEIVLYITVELAVYGYTLAFCQIDTQINIVLA